MITKATTLILVWLIFIGSYVSNFFRYKHILLGEENNILKYVYAGFWYTSNIWAFLLFLILVVWFYTYLHGKLDKLSKGAFVVVSVFSIITLYLSNKLINLEYSNYSNYIYSQYGITKDSLTILFVVSLIFVILLGLFIYNEVYISKTSKKVISNNKITPILFMSILLWYCLQLFINSREYINLSKFTYDKEFANYKYIMALTEFVPESGNVVLPPQSSKWPDISNIPIVRYFLYPRILISATYLVDQESINNFNEVYVVNLGNWPNINVGEKSISFDDKNTYYYKTLETTKIDNDVEVYKIKF